MSNPTDKILFTLHKKSGSFISGQALADSLGVSRAAVWKVVESLRADGYVIESASARGYRLTSVPDRLGEREITLGLKTAVLGHRVVSLSETDSTNSDAARLAAEGAPEGTLVVADSQRAGRGRLGRKWVSPPGVNVYMSLILRPRISPAEAPMITLAAAAALAGAVNGLYGLGAGIKWPNDLLIGGKKCAGILTEMSAEPDTVRHVILGIGMDVNMAEEEFPAEIRGIATSLMIETGRRLDRPELVRRFLEEFERVYGLLTAGDRKAVLELWRGMSVTLGRRVRVSGPRGDITGFAKDLNDDGNLVVVMEDGTLNTVISGDVYPA